MSIDVAVPVDYNKTSSTAGDGAEVRRFTNLNSNQVSWEIICNGNMWMVEEEKEVEVDMGIQSTPSYKWWRCWAE